MAHSNFKKASAPPSELEKESYCLLFDSKSSIIESTHQRKEINKLKIYEELGAMLDEMGQTKQTFYETFTRTALRERSIPFIIKAPLPATHKNNKMAAFLRLEESRKNNSEIIDCDREREEAMDEKYGIID